MEYLLIEYADPAGVLDPITVPYRLCDNPVVPRWVERVQAAQQYPIDDPRRFYGFDDVNTETARAMAGINQCVDTINSHRHIIDRKLTNINDQDTLNYLHHIFEVYHGLLGKQTHRFYLTAKPHVRKALSDLNIAVHRCESVTRQRPPSHVVTYFGLPKEKMLLDSDYTHAVNTWTPGTVFLNYVEIGKTLEDLVEDNDTYIAPDAFQPFRHYSADFVVYFGTRSARQAMDKNAKILAYYQQHQAKFGAWQNCFTESKIPVAVLEGVPNLDAIASRQMVQSVKFI